MQINKTILLASGIAALSSVASATTLVTAMMPLNIRSGPGPQYSVVGAIPGRGQATILGCIQGSLWCQVTFNGRQGWAYAQYVTAQLSGRSLVLAEDLSAVPTVTYEPPATVGTAVVPATPAITGTVITRQAAAQPLVITPPPTVYSHPVSPVYLNGEVVEGAGLPEDVALALVPGYDYDYAYVNSVPVLVEPTTRRVTYVYR